MELQSGLNLQFSNWIFEALDELPDNFTITDPCISGHPIVFASLGFLKTFGYSREEVIGRNGRMFQGPRTDRRAVMEIREAIREERRTQISILNYHKDGTPLWILFHMIPVFLNQDGRVTNFIGVQVPIVEKLGPRNGLGRDVFDSCRNRVTSCEFLLGSCRREVCCSDAASEPGSRSAFDSESDSSEGPECESLCKASEQEKQKASNAANNVLSVLSRYSELTGKTVSATRCKMCGTGVLSSALIISLGRIKQSFVLYDPYKLEHPIVYASDAFLSVTGYARHEVIGCSRKLLCGSETDSSTLEMINDSVEGGQTCKARILYYRKDRSPFGSLIHISPVRDASGKIAYFVEVQIEEGANDSHNRETRALSPEQRQLGAVGAVKVAVRTQSIGPSPSR